MLMRICKCSYHDVNIPDWTHSSSTQRSWTWFSRIYTCIPDDRYGWCLCALSFTILAMELFCRKFTFIWAFSSFVTGCACGIRDHRFTMYLARPFIMYIMWIHIFRFRFRFKIALLLPIKHSIIYITVISTWNINTSTNTAVHYHGSKGSWTSCGIYGLLVCFIYSKYISTGVQRVQ